MSHPHQCPLTGQPCNQTKCVHIADVVNGQAQDLQLCKQCAVAYLEAGKQTPPNPAFVAVAINSCCNMPQQSSMDKACPYCGWTLTMLAQKLRFGCSKCYSFFGDEAIHLMKKAHGITKHVGKVPSAWKARREAGVPDPNPIHPDTPPPDPETILKQSIQDQIANMEADMAVKVKEEKYEDAAVIRDAIKILKENTENG